MSELKIVRGNTFSTVVQVEAYRYNGTKVTDFDLRKCTDIRIKARCNKKSYNVDEYTILDNSRIEIHWSNKNMALGGHSIEMTGSLNGTAWRFCDTRPIFYIVETNSLANVPDRSIIKDDYYTVEPRSLYILSPKGEKGDKGDRGPIGFQGPKGDRGDAGPKGDVGPLGERGPQGERGLQGIPGPKGPQGERGPQGETGPAGPLGPQGEQGLRGLQGERGLQGPQGERGPLGERGQLGILGERGLQGPKGDTGETGPVGPKGDKGDKGETGPQGPKGDSFTYADFTQEQLAALTGLLGPKGDTGELGPQGIQGPAGQDGSNGSNGQDGITPHIDSTTGNWFIGSTDTGVHAQGPLGPAGTTANLATVATSGSYNDLIDTPTIPVLPTNHVTTDTAQTVSGNKTFSGTTTFSGSVDTVVFTGRNPIKMKSSDNTTGFTFFNSGDSEKGYVQYNQTNNALYLGKWHSDAKTGFLNETSNNTKQEIYVPDTGSTGVWYIPISITDGTNTVTAGSNGSVDISTLLPAGANLSNYVLTSNTAGLLKNDGTVDTTQYAKVWNGTLVQYDALAPNYDANTIYIIS